LDSVPAIVLGGTGYVAGELLRLISGHPHLKLAGAMSEGSSGESVAGAFPHLATVYRDEVFKSREQIDVVLRRERAPAILAAAPHGVSAALIDSLLATAEKSGHSPRVVDISADFRYATAQDYTAVYRRPHGAPERIAQFSCAVPEHIKEIKTPHMAHPGCFATTILLAAVPLLALDLIEPQLFVAAVTGSTGSGRTPSELTHHPRRHSDFYAYNALTHRHSAEIAACAQAATGTRAHFAFVPHSGPYARGIHATVQAVLKRPLDHEQLVARLTDFYAHSSFVGVSANPPRLKDVVACNYARLGAFTDGRTVAVMSTADNLNKGAAGGALQLMNRMLGFPEGAGLTAPAAGWT
jgi:N-acetyl-gamma-glutamyl-phosphate reductase common form